MNLFSCKISQSLDENLQTEVLVTLIS